MFEYLSIGGRVAVGLILVMVIIRQILSRRASLKAHPPIDYEPPAGGEPWRWAVPPEDSGLVVSQSADASTLTLPTEVRSAPVVALLLAATLAVVVGVLLVGLPLRDPVPGIPYWLPILFAAGIGAAAWALTFAGSHVIAIELMPESVTFTIRRGVWFRSRVVIPTRARGRLTVKGSVESALGMETGRCEPDFHVFLGRRRRLVLYCNRTAGTWVVGALERWLAG